MVDCIKRLGTTLIALGFALALFAPVANAKVMILDSDSGRQVDTISKSGCRVDGKKGNQDFFASAKSDSGKFTLTAFIDAPVFRGFRRDYTIYYGGKDPEVFLRRRSDEELFSSFKLPGTPAGAVGGGAIDFREGGRKMGIGLSPAPNKSSTEGYVFAGVIPCKYPKRR